MVTSKFDLKVIFEVKWGYLAFGRIFSAEGGQIRTHFIKQNIWNFLIPIPLVTSKCDLEVIFKVKWGNFQFILLLFPKSKFGQMEHFQKKNTETSWTSLFLLGFRETSMTAHSSFFLSFFSGLSWYPDGTYVSIKYREKIEVPLKYENVTIKIGKKRFVLWPACFSNFAGHKN